MEHSEDSQVGRTRVLQLARANSEGERCLDTANGKAPARYEIAQLPDGQYAIQIVCRYRSGDLHGIGVPWTVYGSRKECLDYFLERARRHFGIVLRKETCDHIQFQAQQQMNELLLGGGCSGLSNRNRRHSRFATARLTGSC